jgi:hypothetical protein
VKLFWQYSLLVSALALSGCGGKSGPASAPMSSTYTLQTFDDIDQPSSLNMDTLKKDIPRVVDIKDSMTSVKDQDERGTCSFFAATAIVESAIKKKMNIDVNLSEEYLNYAVKSRGFEADDEGGFPTRNLFEAIDKKAGFLLERDWPYQPIWFGNKTPCLKIKATDSSAPKECFSHNSPPEKILAQKIPGDVFEILYLASETPTNEIIETIAEYKDPLSIAVPVNFRGWPDSGDVSYDDSMRKECKDAPDTCGFHVVVLTGYDLDKKVFFFKNSWGKTWGHEGYGTMTFDMVDRHAGHTSATVHMKNIIKLPDDYDKDYVNFKDFSLSSVEKNDHSVEIKTTGKIENVGFHTIAIFSTLVKKELSSIEAPNDKNTHVINLSEDDQAKYGVSFVSKSQYDFSETEVTTMEWSAAAPKTLLIAGDKMQIPTISDLLFKNNELFVRSSLYVYTDDSKYKPLKRIYHPINY